MNTKTDLFGDPIPYNPLENFKVFEHHVAGTLKPRYSDVKEQWVLSVNKPNGKTHKIDSIIPSLGLLIECKLQNTDGTAEEKIDYTMRCLQYAIDKSKGIYKKAIIVMAGNAWTFKQDIIDTCEKMFPAVEIVIWEDDKELLNLPLEYNIHKRT
mgnify:FL=1|jgi:hypothetical protein|tara:strand:+ start:54 stop:515 length:462 start_codon:yes stop_codon:yes gene_type:complete